MFQLLPCSRCQRTFSVRSEVSDQALLKCPNCGNQFRLGELLDAFYAPWEIVENPGGTFGSATAASVTAAGATAIASPQPVQATPAGLALDGSAAETSGVAVATSAEHQKEGLSLDGPDLELAADDQAGSPGIALQGAGKAKPTTDWSNYKPITHEEFQRMKRADRSPFWSTLQVVLGGAAAIPVSLLLIWHVLDKDVAGAGPAVARYVPWIVPEKFRGLPAAEAWEPNPESQRVPRRGESGFRNFDDVMPLAEDEADDAASSDQPPETPSNDGAVVATLTEDSQPTDATGTDAETDEAQTPRSTAADQPTADLFALLNRTNEKVEQWKEVSATSDTNRKREAAISLVEDLSSLGVHLSTLPDTQGAPALVRDKAQEISRAIKRQPDLTEVLHNAAKAQLNGNLPRFEDGWVLVCTVGEMLDQGDSWRIMVADATLLPLDVPKIEIPKSVAPQLTSGQRLLLLGKFIAPPSTENSEAPAPALETFRASFSYGL